MPHCSKRFEPACGQRLDPQAFFKAKRLEQDERYLRFQDTPFSLEPNIKENPGGLRDLQVILWIAQAAGHGNGWLDLKKAVSSPSEEYLHLDTLQSKACSACASGCITCLAAVKTGCSSIIRAACRPALVPAEARCVAPAKC